MKKYEWDINFIVNSFFRILDEISFFITILHGQKSGPKIRKSKNYQYMQTWMRKCKNFFPNIRTFYIVVEEYKRRVNIPLEPISGNKVETFKVSQIVLESLSSRRQIKLTKKWGFFGSLQNKVAGKPGEKHRCWKNITDVFSVKTGIRQVKIKKFPQGLGCEAAGSEIYIKFWSEWAQIQLWCIFARVDVDFGVFCLD